MDIGTATEQAHREAMLTRPEDVARFLQDGLGQKLVAYMTGTAAASTVGRWAAGQASPSPANLETLRSIYQVFALLLSEESTQTARSWFVGLNPQLSDDSPAERIAAGDTKAVMLAAMSFISAG